MITQRARDFVATLMLAVTTAFTACADAQHAPLDLGATREQVHSRFGPARRTWSIPSCPEHRLETRRAGQSWLKLVFGRDGRLAAVGITQLAPPPRGDAVDLRWPGLQLGLSPVRAYPPPTAAQPVAFSTGAKQLYWFERLFETPAGRDRFVGGLVLSDMSGFALAAGFPFDVAEAVFSSGLHGDDLASSELARPLLAWRARQPPNAFIEAMAEAEQGGVCDLFALARLDYTDVARQR